MRGWGLPWLLMGLAGGASPVAEPVRIQADAPLTRTLDSGEIHVYKLNLQQDDYARLEVIQQGLDVFTVVRSPSGGKLAHVDTLTGRFSTENVSLVAEEKGEYEVEVSTRYPGESGKYKLILAALHRAGPDDRVRVEAERAELKACRGIDSARLALEKWRALGDRVREARALTCLGAMMGGTQGPAEAIRVFELSLSDQRKLQDREGMAETLRRMGRTLRLMGEGRRAIAALEESLSLWRELKRPDLAAEAQRTIAQVHQDLGDSEAALDALEKSLVLSREAGDRPQQARTLAELGNVHLLRGDSFEARDKYQEALDLARAAGRRDTEGEVLSLLGSVHQRLGMLDDALEHYEAARQVLHELGHTQEAVTLNNLGMLLIELGSYENAREFLEQALPLQSDPRNRALTRVGLSRIAEETGQSQEAAEHIEEALEIQREARNRDGLAEALRAQGLLLVKLGKPAEAVEKLRESVDIYQELGRRSRAAVSLRGLARAQAALGNTAEARELYEESRRLSEALGEVGSQVLTLSDEGRLEHEAGNLAAARQRLEAALELMEGVRSQVGGESLRAQHFASVRETYERYVDVLMQLHRSDPKAGLDGTAFEVAEQSRARGLLDVLARARVDVREGDPEDLARELRLRQEMNDKARLLEELGDDEESRARAAALRQEIDKLAAEHQIVEALLTHGSSYESLKKPSLAVADVQRLLDPDTVLVEYLLGEPRSYLWVVGPASLQAFELPGRQEIGELARRLHERLKDPADRDAPGERKDRQLLFQRVLGPALQAIAGRRLVIVPDGALHYVPFAALLVEPSVALVERHEISLLPSAAVLGEIRRAGAARSPRSASLAIVADPAYGAGLQELAWTRAEAEAIRTAALGRDVQVSLRHDATKELITSGRLDRFRALHIATHGFFDSEHPQLSWLAFSQVDAKGQPLNGMLRLQDLYSLRLRSELVVLSGCETGLGRELRGEGLVGLTHGFFHAGANQVVASLWPVRDKASAELMKRFYRAMIRDRLRPAAALRAAQIEMLNDRDHRAWRDPYFWAPFVAQGDWAAGGL